MDARKLSAFELAVSGSKPALKQAIAQIGPTHWWQMDEVSGSTLSSVGSAGANNITVAGTTVLGTATGVRGDAIGVQTDGLTSYGTFATQPQWSNVTMAMLAKITGEGADGYPELISQLNGGVRHEIFVEANNSLKVVLGHTTSTATTQTAANSIPFGEWRWYFVQYNATTKKAHVYIGQNKSASELAYATQTAGTGTIRTATGGRLWAYTSGNYWLPAITAQLAFFPTLLSLDQMSQLTRLAGV